MLAGLNHGAFHFTDSLLPSADINSHHNIFGHESLPPAYFNVSFPSFSGYFTECVPVI